MKWTWKDKVRKGTSLQDAFEKFEWCKLEDDKEAPELPRRRLHTLISNLKRRIKTSYDSAVVKEVLEEAVTKLEYELENYENPARNVSPRARN